MPTEEKLEEMREAWRVMKRHDPTMAKDLSALVKAFGCTEFMFVSFESPPRGGPRPVYRAPMEEFIRAHPERAREVLAEMDQEGSDS